MTEGQHRKSHCFAMNLQVPDLFRLLIVPIEAACFAAVAEARQVIYVYMRQLLRNSLVRDSTVNNTSQIQGPAISHTLKDSQARLQTAHKSLEN